MPRLLCLRCFGLRWYSSDAQSTINAPASAQNTREFMTLNPVLAMGSGPASALFGLAEPAVYVCSNPATLIGVLVTATTGLPPVVVAPTTPPTEPTPAAPSEDELPPDWPFCCPDPTEPVTPPTPPTPPALADPSGPGELWFAPAAAP